MIEKENKQIRVRIPDPTIWEKFIKHVKSEESVKKIKPLQEEIEATDKIIDNMVYGLYGLTNEEIQIIEKYKY